MNKYNDFIVAKDKATNKLEEALRDDKVDKDIILILGIINDLNGFYTSSSCSGRIVLMEIPFIGDKKNACFLGKWHRKVDIDEIKSASEKAKKGILWILAQSPIIHIGVDDLDKANWLVKTGVYCGFKNSCIKSSDKKIIVEICSTERLDSPVGYNGIVFCNDDFLDLIVNIANDVLKKSKMKIERLNQYLQKSLSSDKSTI